MAILKDKDKEVEIPDEFAGYAMDETGVPYRNRAAEWRRKHEKQEKELERLRQEAAERAEKAERAARQPAPYDPGSYSQPAQPQAYQPQAPRGLTADEARALAREEAARFRQEEEYEREAAKLREEWPDYEEHEEEVLSLVRELGYTEDQFKNFGPRDRRLVKRAWEGARSAKPERRKRSPQEVVLDTGGGDGTLEESASPWDAGKIETWDRAKLNEEIERAKSKPRIGDD